MIEFCERALTIVLGVLAWGLIFVTAFAVMLALGGVTIHWPWTP